MTAPGPQNTDTTQRSSISFRRVLILCVPALILGAILRISFLAAIPEIYYGSDSNSYFEAARKVWEDGGINLNRKRRFVYPILLAFTPLLPGTTAVSVAVLQHALGLAIVVGIGWIVAQMTRFPNLWVPVATCISAVWPRMLWYEHEMIAEVWLLAAFVAAVALAVPCGVLRDKRRLFWFLAACVLIVATKPQGRPVWLGLLAVAVAMTGNPLKWEKKSLTAVAFSILIILTSGSGQQGSWLLLNSAFPFVKTEGEPYSEYRAILRPYVEKARADLGNYAEKQGDYKKALSGGRKTLGDKWVALADNKDLYPKVAKRLAFEGILAHPFEYSHLVLRKVALVAAGENPGRISPPNFWKDQESASAERLGRPNNEIKLLYGMETDAYLRMVEERRQRTLWIEPWVEQLAKMARWTRYRKRAAGENPDINLRTLGWFLALGALACLSPRHFVCRALLWLPAALYLAAAFGIGDSVRRYLHPVEWVGFVLIVIGLDTAVTLITNGISRLRSEHSAALSPS